MQEPAGHVGTRNRAIESWPSARTATVLNQAGIAGTAFLAQVLVEHHAVGAHKQTAFGQNLDGLSIDSQQAGVGIAVELLQLGREVAGKINIINTKKILTNFLYIYPPPIYVRYIISIILN